jgi:hypothetical protein
MIQRKIKRQGSERKTKKERERERGREREKESRRIYKKILKYLLRKDERETEGFNSDKMTIPLKKEKWNNIVLIVKQLGQK